MSRYLLDTHVWLWAQANRARLRDTTLATLEDPNNELLLSAASTWEMAIKHRLGKLPLPEPPRDYVPDRMQRSRTTALPIELAHTLRVADLPDLHRDPFDRLIIAQAQVLNIPIITADAKFNGYDVTLIAA